MGRLVLTRFNKRKNKVEQVTIENVFLKADYFDSFGRRTRIIDLCNDDMLVQNSYAVTRISDQRLVEDIDYHHERAE